MNNIVIILGGCSLEHEFSFLTSNYIFNLLIENDTWNVLKLYYITLENELVIYMPPKDHTSIDKDLILNNGYKADITKLSHLIKNDNCAVFSTCQGKYGEDGHLQAFSSFYNLNSNLDNVFTASICDNKWSQSIISKQLCNGLLQSIPGKFISKKMLEHDSLENLVKDWDYYPFILKPNSLGGSYLLKLCTTLDLAELNDYANHLFQYDNAFLIQKQIIADEIACCCIIQEGELEILPMLKVNYRGALMDHEEKFKIKKYKWEFIQLPTQTYQQIEKIIKNLHQFYQFAAYVRFDFLVDENEIYLLEININPGIYPGSLLYRALEASRFTLFDILNAMNN